MDIEDIIYEIYTYLPIEDIIKKSKVSKNNLKIFNHPYLWKILTKRDYNINKGTKQDYFTLYNFFKIKQFNSLNNAFLFASINGHADVVKLLLQNNRVDPSADNNDAIILASENGHTDVVRLLLQDNRINPSAYNNIAIRWASNKGHTGVVELLLQNNRVDPSVDYNYAIIFASANGHIDIVELLLQDDRVDPSADDNVAIRLASENGHINVVRLLIQDNRVRSTLTKNQIKKYKLKWILKILYMRYI